MPVLEKSGSNGAQEQLRTHNKYNSSASYDVEANSPLSSPTTAPFPGARYGFEPSDQPSQPPRRVKSHHSLSHNQSLNSLNTDSNAPPPLPSSQQHQGQVPAPPRTADTTHQTDNNNEDAASIAEELAWGPSHPCFPHLNPHVPLASPLHISTRIIRIRRDWMLAGDLAPTYSNIYPEILDPLLPEPEFRRIIDHINSTLLSAFDPFSSLNWLDGMMGLITGWLWEDLRPATGFKAKVRDLERWMEAWNQRVGSRDGVKLIPLRRTGFMGLDIQIPDPQVRVVDGDYDDDERGIDAYDESRGGRMGDAEFVNLNVNSMGEIEGGHIGTLSQRR